MSTTPNNKKVDPAHPTQEPFSSPGESSNIKS
ncbi:hypothetical protein INT46_009410 [Mucor plumbeus]|uniref:Uncharacterized protein n=1 Tax=Mucor plumbeus TaxID=97098 RepID=A0A8H7R971_9FUNG|nr:hypothetical protein INT46_009410 [Mucor plumbeus]